MLLSSRELVLIGEVLRLEASLKTHLLVDTTGSQEASSLALEQLEGLTDRLSSEDTLVWNFVDDLTAWMREAIVTRYGQSDFSLAHLLEEAQFAKGSALTEDEVSQFVTFVDGIDSARKDLEDE